MTVLLPRLPTPAAERILDGLIKDDTLQWRGFDSNMLPQEVRYASSGGSAIAPNQLQVLRLGIESVAEQFGFGRGLAKATQASFDAGLAEYFIQEPRLMTGEALRDDVWNFISVVMAPDIVHWRFGNTRERYLGGVRNTFQRLWMRARALDRGEGKDNRWGLLESLTEDAMVQITERPSIGADTVLARELAEAWVRARSRLGLGNMEDVMRRAILRLRLRNEIRSLSLLPPSDLQSLLDEFFDSAAAAIASERDASLIKPEEKTGDLGIEDKSAEAREPGDSHGQKVGWAIWRRK